MHVRRARRVSAVVLSIGMSVAAAAPVRGAEGQSPRGGGESPAGGEWPRHGVALLSVARPEGSAAGDWERSVETHAALIRLAQEPLLLGVLQDPGNPVRRTGWFEQFKGDLDAAAAALEKALAVRVVPGTSLIQVRAAIDPPADAAAVVNAVCDAAVRRDREAAERRIERRASLLRDELRGVEIELNEAVGRQIREVEIQLGGGGGTAGTPPAGRAKQLQFDRLLEEEARVRARVSGHRTRLQTFRRALDEGRTPPEVEVRINDNPRYVRARQRLDDLEAEQGPLPPMSRPRPDDVNLEPGALTRKPDKADPPGKAGERADPGKEGGEAAAAARKQRRVAAQEKVDEIREELKSTYTEAMKEALGNEIAAASADAARVEEAVTRVGEQMAELNKLTGEYRHLLDRRQELRRRQGALADEIARLTLAGQSGPGGELHLVQRAAGPR